MTYFVWKGGVTMGFTPRYFMTWWPWISKKDCNYKGMKPNAETKPFICQFRLQRSCFRPLHPHRYDILPDTVYQCMYLRFQCIQNMNLGFTSFVVIAKRERSVVLDWDGNAAFEFMQCCIKKGPVQQYMLPSDADKDSKILVAAGHFLIEALE